MAGKMLFANNAKGRLNAGITSGATTLTLQAGQGALFPQPTGGDFFRATLIDLSGNIEIIHCTQRTGDTFDVIVRAQEGTSSIPFSSNDRVELRWTKESAMIHQQLTDVQLGSPVFFGVAGGTADALSGTIASYLTALVNGMRVRGHASAANATGTPTFTLTLGTTGTGPKTIVKGSNAALEPGEIAGADAPIDLEYDSSLDKWVLLNPYRQAVPTGMVAPFVGTTAPTGWVLGSGKTIGSAASGATERANADTVNLFTLLWNSMADAEAPVSGGRGASAAADFAANKTIVVPDLRGRSIFGKDDMGGSAANRITAGVAGFAGTTLGKAGGDERMHQHNHGITDPGHGHTSTYDYSAAALGGALGYDTPGNGSSNLINAATTGITINNAGAGASQNVPPAFILNFVIKL